MPGGWCNNCPQRVSCLVDDGVTDCEVVGVGEDLMVHLRDPEVIINETGLIIGVNLKTFQVIATHFKDIVVRKNPLIRHKHNPEGLEAHWGEGDLTNMFVIMEKEEP